MYYFVCIIFTVALSVTSANLRGVQNLFPELREYVYKLETNISTGSDVPVESYTHWSLEARLYAHAYNASMIRYQLVDVKVTIYDGVKTTSRADLPTAAAVMKDAWDVSYQESGAVGAVYLSENEPLWSGNIKRAIALNLQITQPENSNTMSYTMQEPCLHGICIVEYSSVDGKTIRKTNDIPTAHPGYGRFFWYSVPVDTCYDNENKNPFVGSAERIYKLEGKKGLVALNTRSTLQYHTSSHVLVVNTELKLTLEKNSDPRPFQNLVLRYSYPVYYPQYYKQPYNERLVTEQTKLVQIANEYLTKITKGIDEDRALPNRELVHNLDAIELQKIMSQMEYDTLMKLYQELAVGTSYETETSRNVFFEMLPYLKSSASALFIKYLIIEHKQTIEDTTLLSLIRKLPFNVANYSEDLLTKMEAFTILGPDFKKDTRYACILSYATLAYFTYINGGCSSDYFSDIVTKYFKMYTEYPAYQDRLIWLQGLSNLQVGPVHNYLAPKIMNASTDPHERFLGLWATIPNVAADPSLSTLLSWPILSNENEPISLRIAALMQILATTEVTPGRILDLHNYIMRSDNGQLKKFWHTTARSLKTSVYNCYPSARYISKMTKKSFYADPAFWATGNYIYGTSSNDNQGSAYLQFMSIGKPSTGLPGFIYFQLRSTRDGSVVDDLRVMLIAEGLPARFYLQLSSMASRNVTLDDLVHLLSWFESGSLNEEKMHIDVIVKVHDKTVYATHLNHTEIGAWKENELRRYVQDFLHSGSHINQQMVSFPMQVELDLGTEFGTPVASQNTMSSLSSIRGGLSASWTDEMFTFETDLTFRSKGLGVKPSTLARCAWDTNDRCNEYGDNVRNLRLYVLFEAQSHRYNLTYVKILYRGTALTSLAAIGPVIFSEHTTRTQQSAVMQLPIKFKIDTRANKKFLEYHLLQPPTGLAIHGRSQIQVKFETPTGGVDTQVHTVANIEQPKDEINAFANCDDFKAIYDIWKSDATPLDSKIRIISSFISSNFIIRHGMILMTVHPQGSCGTSLNFKNPVVWSITLKDYDAKMDGLKLRIGHEIGPLTDPKKMSLEQGIEYSTSAANDSYTANHYIGTKVDAINSYWLCLNETVVSTSWSPDTSNLPSDLAGKFRIFSGYGTNGCPTDFDRANTLFMNYTVENSGLYSDDGITRYLNMEVVGKLHDFLTKDISQSLRVPDPKGEKFNFTVRVKEHNGLVGLSINRGHEIYQQSETIGRLLENWNRIQSLRKFGMYKKCTVKYNTVQSFNGTSEELKSPDREKITILAERIERPEFGIWRYKNETYSFFTAHQTVYVTTLTSGIVSVQLEGQDVDYEKGFENSEKTIRISRSGHALLIEAVDSGIRFYYTPRETTILVPSIFIGVACGECVAHHGVNDC